MDQHNESYQPPKRYETRSLISNTKTSRSSRSSISNAATKAKARAEAAMVVAKYAPREAEMMKEKAKIEAEATQRKAELEANLYVLNTERSATAAAAEAAVYENAAAAMGYDSLEDLAQIPPEDTAQHTSKYVEAHYVAPDAQQPAPVPQQPLTTPASAPRAPSPPPPPPAQWVPLPSTGTNLPETFVKNERLQCKEEPKEAHDASKVFPSTSAKVGKRKSDLQGESSKGQSPKKRRDRKPQPNREQIILSDVKKIMRSVLQKLPNQGYTKLNDFLRKKIDRLETDKREVIGVFGRTGAGKSSLINAVIGEKDLLPTADDGACTSVMIKVESNPNNSEYKADIEFITKQEWEDEVWSMKQFHGDKADQEEDDDHREIVEKLTALYGEEWKENFPENPVDPKYFREIPEFLQSEKKTLMYRSAEKLSENLIKYTRSPSKHRQSKEIKRWFWPLVKCVTIKVPDNDLLQHVTLVEPPGSGDRNKSRDKMWKGIVRGCSTVWILAEIKRVTSDKEPWDILMNTCSLMGHGGQCQRIHFICTMSDVIGGSGNRSHDVRDRILQRNEEVKEDVKEEFKKLNQFKKHFSDDFFKVFTVSSTEFLEKQHLDPEDTEIPKLQEVLKNLNDCHSETLNYVSGAYGILSLMHGANSTERAEKKPDVCAELEKNLNLQLGRVQEAVEDAHQAFEARLTEGVEKSKRSCEKNIKSFLDSTQTASGFHRTLKCVVENDGVHKTTEGKQINLNATLSSCLTDSIDEEFRKTFLNEDKSGSFKGAIRSFSLNTERLMKENKSLELQLMFLKTEEENIKTKLNDIIREKKKIIYSSLTETIKKKMLDCYKSAAAFSGTDSRISMRKTIEQHVKDSKNRMFEDAKAEMLDQMNDLKDKILKILKKTLEESIEISLKTDDSSIPDVAAELKKVKEYYKELKRSSKELLPPDF